MMFHINTAPMQKVKNVMVVYNQPANTTAHLEMVLRCLVAETQQVIVAIIQQDKLAQAEVHILARW